MVVEVGGWLVVGFGRDKNGTFSSREGPKRGTYQQNAETII